MSEVVTFGGAISAQRKVLRLNQKELAQRVLKEDGTPITPQYLNDIENDRRSPSSDHMVGQLAQALGLDPDYLSLLAGKVPEDIRRAGAAPEQVSKAMLAFRKALGVPKGKP